MFFFIFVIFFGFSSFFPFSAPFSGRSPAEDTGLGCTYFVYCPWIVKRAKRETRAQGGMLRHVFRSSPDRPLVRKKGILAV